MKFTLGWLKEHLDTDADLDTVCARLTALGAAGDFKRTAYSGLSRHLTPFSVLSLAKDTEATCHPANNTSHGVIY